MPCRRISFEFVYRHDAHQFHGTFDLRDESIFLHGREILGVVDFERKLVQARRIIRQAVE